MWGPDNMLIKCDSEVNVQYLGFTFSSKKKVTEAKATLEKHVATFEI